MLPVARQFSNRWWRRRPHIGLSHTPIIKLNFHSLPQTKVEEELDDFLPWLERKSGTEISSALFIGKSTHGRSLFASKSIRAGDCILKVPYSVQLAPDNLPPELKSLLGDQVGDVAKVAIVILFEQKMGHDSKWAPYISRLPRPEQMHSTIFWSEDELEMIRQSSLYQETIDLRSLVEKEFLAIRKHKARGSLFSWGNIAPMPVMGFLGWLPQLKYTAATASPFVTDYVTMNICIVAFFVYFGSLTVKLLAHAPRAEMGEFIDNIIFLFGTLALILLLPILVRAFGLFALLVWTIYLVRNVATKKSHKSVLCHVFNKIEEQINGLLVDAGEPILS